MPSSPNSRNPMLRRFSKVLFPNLPWDVRKRRMNTLILVLMASTATNIGIVMVVAKNNF